MMAFSVKVSDYQRNSMLNICDEELLGTTVTQGDLNMDIAESYYGERIVGEPEARKLLEGASIINMVGEKAVSLSIEMGIGSESGVKTISGVPFLIVFKM